MWFLLLKYCVTKIINKLVSLYNIVKFWIKTSRNSRISKTY